MPIPPLERVADDLFYSAFQSDTEDREDHSFNGIFFELGCDTALPVDSLEISSLWIRGDLGRVRVYAQESQRRIADALAGPADVTERYGTYSSTDRAARELLDERAWGQPAFDEELPRSFDRLVELRLRRPIVVKNGECVRCYVHSDDRGDKGLVYDNSRDLLGRPRSDGILQIYDGHAHLSSEPFGTAAPWYAEMSNSVSSLRKDRRFVGRVSYGVRWRLWQPERSVHAAFPSEFQEVVRVMLRGMRDEGSVLHTLDEDVLMYIFNKHVGWDWFGLSLPPREFPPLASTSGSPRVDALLDAILENEYKRHPQPLKAFSRSTRSNVLLMPLRELVDPSEQVDNDLMKTACAMAATIVSRSEDLKWALQNCTRTSVRISSVMIIVKECLYKLQVAKKANKLGVRSIPKYLLTECVPEALASDVKTVQSVANAVCMHVMSHEHEHSFTELVKPTELEGANDPDVDPQRVKEDLKSWLEQKKCPSVQMFFWTTMPRDDDDDDDTDDEGWVVEDPDWEEDDGDWVSENGGDWYDGEEDEDADDME